MNTTVSPIRRFPNWGVPMLRNVRGCPGKMSGTRPGRSHPTRELALAELDRLEARYPDAVLDRPDRTDDDMLDLVVYEGWRRAQSTNPARQIRLEVVEHREHGYVVAYSYLTYLPTPSEHAA